MKNLKAIITLTSILALSSSYAYHGNEIEEEQYITTALAGAATTGAFYASYKSQDTVDSIKNGGRSFILNPNLNDRAVKLSKEGVKQVQDNMAYGRNHSISYRLSPDITEADARIVLMNTYKETEDKVKDLEEKLKVAKMGVDDRAIARTEHNLNLAQESLERIKSTMEASGSAQKSLVIKSVFTKKFTGNETDKAKAFVSDIAQKGGRFYLSNEVDNVALDLIKSSERRVGAHIALGFVGTVFTVEELVFGSAAYALFNDDRETASSEWVLDEDTASREITSEKVEQQ